MQHPQLRPFLRLLRDVFGIGPEKGPLLEPVPRAEGCGQDPGIGGLAGADHALRRRQTPKCGAVRYVV